MKNNFKLDDWSDDPKCFSIINGNYAPIYDLAVIYLMEGEEEYYSILMEAGRRLGVPACLSESQD